MNTFVSFVNNHVSRCALPGWENDTYTIQSDLHLNAVNRTIPLAVTATGLEYNKCDYITVAEDGQINLIKCERWVYDKSVYETSLAADVRISLILLLNFYNENERLL